MQGVRVGSVGARFYGRSPRDIFADKERLQMLAAEKFNQDNPPLTQANRGKKRKSTVATTAERINQQNIRNLASSSSSSNSSKPGPSSYDPAPELPKQSHLLLETPEGQEELGKLIAITQKQRASHKAFKAKRREYEQFLLEYQKESLQKEKEKIQRKKRKLTSSSSSATQPSASSVIKQIPGHQNQNQQQSQNQQQQHQPMEES